MTIVPSRRDDQPVYVCPGEEHAISRAVHLSRLAAFYPKCRDCPHRVETGHLPTQTVARLRHTEHRIERPSLFTLEGVRGVYLNELTRSKAARMAGALASLLWDEAPLQGRMDSAGERAPAARRIGPKVVLGRDERPSAPDLQLGVAAELRRMGCEVIDIGRVTRPMLWFAVDHLQSAAGIHITGAGCQPSWTGLDFVLRGARPVAAGAGLERIEQRLRTGYSRPLRTGGRERSFHIGSAYEAVLWKHFHALRPLKLVVACALPVLRDWLSRLFGRLPCELILHELAWRSRNLSTGDDPDLTSLRQKVLRVRADFGLLIDDDAQTTALLDEAGRFVPVPALFSLLADSLASEFPALRTVVPHRPSTQPPNAGSREHRIVAADGGLNTLASMSQAMREHQASLGWDAQGRFWFREAFPTSDAVLTLAYLLQALSRSDATVSEAVALAMQKAERKSAA